MGSKSNNFSSTVIAFFLSLPFIVYFAENRLIAKDEGFYNLAAKLVSQGNELYTDFFFPQTPLTAYIYGFFYKIFGNSWYQGRILTGLFTTLLAALLFNFLLRRLNMKYAIFGLIAFLSSNFVFPWYVVIQTYSLSVFYVFLAFFLFSLGEEKENKVFYLFSGICFGLSVSSRLFFLGLAPFVLMYILLNKKYKSIFPLVLGALAGLTPLFYFAIKNWDIFYFNNYGYHAIRSTTSFDTNLKHNLRILKVIFGVVESVKFKCLQLPILLYLSIISFFFSLFKKLKIDLCVYIAFGLFVLNFIPTPSYVQYFSTLIPFLIIIVLFFIHTLYNSNLSKMVINVIILPCLILFFYKLPSDFLRYTKTGEGVIGIRDQDNAKHWNISHIKAISKKINEITKSGEVVFSLWPGYLFETDAVPMKGLENHFGHKVSNRLSAVEKDKYVILGEKEALKKAFELNVRTYVASKDGQIKKIKEKYSEEKLEIFDFKKVKVIKVNI